MFIVFLCVLNMFISQHLKASSIAKVFVLFCFFFLFFVFLKYEMNLNGNPVKFGCLNFNEILLDFRFKLRMKSSSLSSLSENSIAIIRTQNWASLQCLIFSEITIRSIFQPVFFVCQMSYPRNTTSYHFYKVIFSPIRSHSKTLCVGQLVIFDQLVVDLSVGELVINLLRCQFLKGCTYSFPIQLILSLWCPNFYGRVW